MVAHPNRSKRESSPARNPTPDEIIQARRAAGRTQAEAAELVHSTAVAWQKWEYGERRMHPATFELFKLKTGQMPLQI